jgi:hypothetical protein
MPVVVWSYTPGGTRLGDRIMALKPFMLEKGGQKYWNELYTAMTRLIVGVTGNIQAGSSIGAIDLANALDVTPAVPKNWQDPMIQAVTNTPTAPQGRQMPGYNYPTTQIFVFQGFNG